MQGIEELDQPAWDVEVDLSNETSGVTWPMVLIKSRRAMNSMRGGEVLRLITPAWGVATYARGMADLPEFIIRLGHELIEGMSEGDRSFFYIRKTAAD